MDTSIGAEINTSSILALEEQIKEGRGDVIQLKRTRNSLLNIFTRVPPEILGYIFRWNVIPAGAFGGLQKGSYNFLLVCHHWFEVASHTPSLWNFWGNTLEQWSQRYQRYTSVPLDLTLNDVRYWCDTNTLPFGERIRNALRDRAARGSIRSAHLRSWKTDLFRSVISSLTPDGEGIRDSGIESLILEHNNLDVSDFLAHHRFPKLRHLRLFVRAETSTWDRLKLDATALTTLSLAISNTSAAPSTSQLLSMLTSYPSLRDLSLYEGVIPQDVGDGVAVRVSLRYLRRLYLKGNFHHVFRLLHQLEYPDILDQACLELLECTGEGFSKFLEPYLQDRIRRDDRFQDRLGLHASSAPRFISFKVNTADATVVLPEYRHPFISFTAEFRDRLPQGAEQQLCVNLVTLIPRGHVVGFTGELSTDLLSILPNLEDLYLNEPVVSDMFLQPDPLSPKKLLPFLRRLCLDCPVLQSDDYWSPLITYLIHQTSGGQAISLRLCGDHPPIPPGVVREIEGLVGEFDLGYLLRITSDVWSCISETQW